MMFIAAKPATATALSKSPLRPSSAGSADPSGCASKPRAEIACCNAGISYSRFMEGLKAANIGLDRKILSDIAIRDEVAFNALVKQAQDALKTKAAKSA